MGIKHFGKDQVEGWEIYTSTHKYPILRWEELTLAQKDLCDTAGDFTGIVYKGTPWELNQFLRLQGSTLPGLPPDQANTGGRFVGWDGICACSTHTALLLRWLPDQEDNEGRPLVNLAYIAPCHRPFSSDLPEVPHA